MTAEQPIVGNVVTFTVTFSVLGVPTDPAGPVTISVRDPNGVRTSYTGGALTHASPGVYGTDVLVSVAGRWVARGASGAGAGQAADEVVIYVGASAA